MYKNKYFWIAFGKRKTDFNLIIYNINSNNTFNIIIKNIINKSFNIEFKPEIIDCLFTFKA